MVGSSVGRTTRAASAAASEGRAVTPTPVNRRGRGRRNTPARDDDNDKPSIQNKNSKAYGSSGKIAAPQHVEASQALRPAGDQFAGAVDEAQAAGSGNLGPINEEPVNEEPANEEPEEDANGDVETQSEVNDQIRAEMPTGHDTTSYLSFSHWAPRGLFNQGNRGLDVPEFAGRDHRPTSFKDFLLQILGVFIQAGKYLLTGIGYLSEMVNSLARNPWSAWITGLIIFFLIFDMNAGPLLPSKYDVAFLKKLRDRSKPPGSCSQLSDARYAQIQKQLTNAQDRIEYLEKTCAMNIDNHDEEPRINYFEPGQGARIVQKLTSPTLSTKEETTMSFIKTRFAFSSYNHIPVAGTAFQALHKWEDGGIDRWCAPRSRGKSQLTVQTARLISPTDLIVEHISIKRSITMGDAPREIELWAQIRNATTRAEIFDDISEHNSDLLEDSSPQLDRELADAQALGPEYVLLGRWIFNIWSAVEVQKFPVPVDLAALGARSNTFALRVNSNWGSLDATCINRVRLYGVDRSGREPEYLEQPGWEDRKAMWS